VWNKPTSVTRFDEANQPQTWTFTYDAAKGTLLTTTNPLDQKTTLAYTARGQLESVTDALDHATRYEYNATGDLVKVIDALLNETHFGVDGAGRRILTVDALNNITRTAYNGINQITRITDAKNQQTTLAYDPAGRLESVTNARSFAIESYGYDSGDRLKTRTDAKLRQTLYNYDTSGRLESMTDRRGQTTTYAYDDQDRLISVTRGDGVTRLSYDAIGRLSEVSDPSGTISYAYDAVDRVVRETQATGGATNIIEYGYDALDRRTTRTIVGVSGEVTTYGYDRANRLTSIGYRGQTTTLDYDAAGRLTLTVLPNGIKQALTYDDADRLISITYSNPDDTLIEVISYGYDAAGRRIVETKSTSPLPDTLFTASYDEADRMTAITFTGTGKTFALSYDDNGNLIEKRENANPSNVTTYSWDSRNRLTGIVAPNLIAAFEYDAFNRRISRTVNGETTRYIYDGRQALGEVVNGAPVGLLTGLNLDEVIARYTAQGARTYLTDALNTVLAQTKEDRSILNYYTYSPYGESSPLGADENNSIQYTGRENDQTSLYYYRARYYDPRLKRFISEDPIGTRAGPNFYAYVRGSPVMQGDPTGLYAPPIHADITLTAFEGSGLSPMFAWEVARANMAWDSDGTQHEEQAHTHGMSRSRESIRDAVAKTQSFINYQLSLCTVEGLGRALHAAQDSTARGHVGAQPFSSLWNLLMTNPSHYWHDYFVTSSNSNYQQGVTQSRELIRMYREKCGCR
jgi:RHS repeat-associated protein